MVNQIRSTMTPQRVSADDARHNHAVAVPMTSPAPTEDVAINSPANNYGLCTTARTLANQYAKRAAEWQARGRWLMAISVAGAIGSVGTAARHMDWDDYTIHTENPSWKWLAGISAASLGASAFSYARSRHFQSMATREARYFLLQCAEQDYEGYEITPEVVGEFLLHPHRFPIAARSSETTVHPGWQAQFAFDDAPASIADPSAAFFVNPDFEEEVANPAPAYRRDDPIIDAIPYVAGALTVGAALVGAILAMPASLEATPAGVMMPISPNIPNPSAEML